ncbi:DMT family transporter [Sphingosinicella sp. BN140058]|uniref:DMT family transporter n=1 Tax=Sphingosinicella sp. BN140058 TaxID=1892855 RepID=UPI0010110DE8|nr:EamA family transporter [Sphingosinicella sp. BN140058]QAY76294.1 EamA/RhaT family transporter [Sphingosinicella sp. BN140058]
MSPRDFLIFVLVCLAWGLNNVVGKIAVTQLGCPPLAFVAARFAIVGLVTWRWLQPAPRPLWRIAAIGLLMGGGGFAFLAMGLRTASPSAAAIVMQINVPLTTLLSVAMLGERVGPRRGLGILLTMAGALLVIWRPGGFDLSPGLLLVAAGAACGSLGAVMMKQMADVRPLQFQAWVSFASFFPLLASSLLFESGQAGAALAAGWPLIAAILYSALVGSVLAHTAFYGLIARYEANLIAPLTLMTPLATIGLGVLITGDAFDARMVAGAMLAMAGVLVVAVQWPERAQG